MPEEKIDKVGLAFFTCINRNDGEYIRGGILVIDESGKPLEFRCSTPVRPTNLQRLLYGKALVPHVAIELMAQPLVRTLRERPMAIFINNSALLELRRKVSVPVFHLRRQGETFGVADETKEKPLVLESSSGRFQAVVVTTHPEFRADADSMRGV